MSAHMLRHLERCTCWDGSVGRRFLLNDRPRQARNSNVPQLALAVAASFNFGVQLRVFHLLSSCDHRFQPATAAINNSVYAQKQTPLRRGAHTWEREKQPRNTCVSPGEYLIEILIPLHQEQRGWNSEPSALHQIKLIFSNSFFFKLKIQKLNRITFFSKN